MAPSSKLDLAVSALFVYPIKACRGVSVGKASVDERGFIGDRRFMIVDAEGQFSSQRSEPRLALVDVAFSPDGLRVSMAGQGELLLPETPVGPPSVVSVWGTQVDALEVEAGSRWFREALGKDLRLVYMPEGSRRPIAGGEAGPGIVSFADGFPFLLVSEASLEELNRRCPEFMRMERFRPNIVIRGGVPHVEDQLTRFSIGEVSFVGPKLCDRCVVTTIDPKTGKSGREPLATLARYRRWNKKVWFGMNLAHTGTGNIALGDALTIPTR